MENELIENLKGRGEKIFKSNISEKEKVLVKMKGSFGEALVITDKKFYVLKWGFMTGNTISASCIAFDHHNISGLNIRKGLLTGTFEILTPATQNVKKSYWGSGDKSALHSENIVTFQNNKFTLFQKALQIGKEMTSSKDKNIQHQDFDKLEKLADLQKKGIISKEEFEQKKKELLDKI